MPAPPPAAAVLFGDRLPLAVAYARLLAHAGVLRGLIGPREVPRLWERHLLNCAVLTDLIPTGARVDDVGSGAGLPGLVLAVRRPDLTVRAIEPLLRRTTFLEEVTAELGLSNVTVVRGRAEDLGRGQPLTAAADVVTARAVAPLDRLLGWCLPLVRPGGVLLAIKGADASDELAAAGPLLERAGVDDATVVRLGAGLLAEPTTVVRVVAAERPARPVAAGRGRATR